MTPANQLAARVAAANHSAARVVVIVELFYTERNHVRNLKIMFRVYYANMIKHSVPTDFLRLLFPNLEELILIHQELKAAFAKRKDEDTVTLSSLFRNKYIKRVHFLFRI